MTGWFCIECADCGARGPDGDEKKAQFRWNNRLLDPGMPDGYDKGEVDSTHHKEPR